jgi:23S rRNA (guanosine2251-2'-O)-methyltransferase
MKPLTGTELKRFIRDFKRSHRPQHEISAMLQSVEYPYNVGAVFRLADGVGISELILTGVTPSPPHPTISKVGRAKDRTVPWRTASDPAAELRQLAQEGYDTVALELVEGAVPYYIYRYASRTCLVVGHEDHGVTRATLQACNAAVFVPMYGRGLSLNVHTALAIVAYHIRHSEITSSTAPDN